ncbi:MAG TPA: sugar ABC transporter substrate-binding protein [Capillimicrobium sp.]|nr:sugar ABC transporter substrate-binding protein [Capillimicrobium sp.]
MQGQSEGAARASTRPRPSSRRPRRSTIAIAAAFLAAVTMAACGTTDGTSDTESSSDAATGAATAASAEEELSGTVYMMLPNTTTPRFTQQDAPHFIEAMKRHAPDVKVEVVNAEGDPQKQLQQAETALNNSPKAIVLVAADPNLSSGILQKAAEADVPVVAYEHEALNGPLASMVIFSPLDAGRVGAKYFAEQVQSGELGDPPVRVARIYGNQGDNYTNQMLEGQNEFLQPLIDDGTIEVVCEDYTPGWDPAKAQTLMEQCLTKTQDRVDAVLGMYDGITAGAIAALKGQGLEGKIPVYGGQNPELSGLQYMLTGWQEDNILKPYEKEADAAAQLAIAAATGAEPPPGLINGEFDNGAEMVPTAFLDVEHISSPDEVQKAVDYGMFSWEEICEGAAARSEQCKTALGG